MEKTITALAVDKMIHFYDGSLHDIEHFLKVWGYAKTIGELEQLDPETQEILELAAITHDIACPLCRQKYANTAGPNQEKEGMPLTQKFYEELGVEQEKIDRIVYLVGHHHTITDVDGADYQILLEADFLVNACESQYTTEVILAFRKNVFRTKNGTALLNTMYGLED